MIFQVTGLPRSGTGFITALLILHPECFAHHDTASERDDWVQYSDRLDKTWKYVGEVTTYGWLPKATRPGPKVFIDRDPVHIVQSLNHALGRLHDVKQFHDMRASALFWAEEHNALVVPFEHLFTLNILSTIWNHVFTPNRLFADASRFPVEKVALFTKMNIQRHKPERMLGSVEQARERLFA